MAQTNDGFLWLGGPNGLVRFDGTRFELFRSPFGDRLLSTNSYSLFAPPTGGLWVGYTLGGFSFVNNGHVTNYGDDVAPSTGSVYGFAQDHDGIVWAGTSSGLWRFDHSGWQHVGVEWNASTAPVRQLGFDSSGTLWALTGGTAPPRDLIYLLPGKRHFKTAQKNLPVSGFMLDADRTIMTGPFALPISEFGEGSEEKPDGYPVLTKDALQFLDRNNGLWMSYDDKPNVIHLPKQKLDDVLNGTSLAGSESYAINPFEMAQLVDREGNIWFGDTKGVHRFSYGPFNRQEFPKETSESSDYAVVADDHGAVWISFGISTPTADLYYVAEGKTQRRAVPVISSFAYRAPDKTFWFSGQGCLWHLVGNDFIRVELPAEMASKFHFLQTIAQDKQGGVWVSFGRHGLYRLADGVWTPYGGREDLPRTGSLMIEFTDSLGRVWFGYTKNQLAMLDGDRVRVFGPSDGVQLGTIMAIHGRGSAIWIGGEFGLEQFDQGHFRNIAAVNDEWLRGIAGIVETSDGDLWINAVSGIFHVRKTEISAALTDSNYRVKGEHFGRREGLPGIAAQMRPFPAAVEGSDGRLWFALRNGVVWLDPSSYSVKKAASPPITIQSIAADDKTYAAASPLSLPARTSSVQLSYSAVSLSDPEAIRFRYRLEETDEEWHEAAAAIPVTYRNLPPGSYHFSVEASDTNGDWSGAPANMAFTLLPAFYQTLWFRLLCVAVFLALFWGLHQLRVRQLQGEERNLREAIESIPAMAWIAGPDGAIQFVNRRWIEYTGLWQLGEPTQVGQIAIHAEDLDRIVRRMGASLVSGEPFEEEMRFRRMDGEYRWFLSRAVPLRDKRGKIAKWYGAATDIQDRKRAEELQAELAHTNRVTTMGEMVASISHELAQPITVTLAHAKASLRWLARDPPEVVEARTGTEKIIEAGVLASEIINRLRSLYKNTPPKRELVAMNEVIGEMAKMMQSEAGEHRVSIRTDLKHDLPMTVADRVQLQQVLMNLMLNGIEAMKDIGGVLTAKSQLNEDGQIQVSIHDIGPGLPLSKVDQIFDAFFTTKPQGSGMGLAISKSIVESLGGRIWANGDSERGVTFHFTLAAAQVETNPPVNAA